MDRLPEEQRGIRRVGLAVPLEQRLQAARVLLLPVVPRHLMEGGAGGLDVLARAELLTENAWTAPTLVGTRLYLRDRKNIVAVDLGSR